MSDVLENKRASVERCIQKARGYYAMPADKPFDNDYIKQDAVGINLQRACEQSIDMANHAIRLNKRGLPADSAESFTLLREAEVIDRDLEKKLIGMVGFRNIVVHQYQKIDYGLVKEVLEQHADDLIKFAQILTTR